MITEQVCARLFTPSELGLIELLSESYEVGSSHSFLVINLSLRKVNHPKLVSDW